MKRKINKNTQTALENAKHRNHYRECVEFKTNDTKMKTNKKVKLIALIIA